LGYHVDQLRVALLHRFDAALQRGGQQLRIRNRAFTGMPYLPPSSVVDVRISSGCCDMAGEARFRIRKFVGRRVERGVESVKKGNPYLIDVITQPR